MLIPAILKDDKRAAQIEIVWKVLNEEPGVDDQTIRQVHKMLDLDQMPCTTILQVHSRAPLLLERGCFNFSKAKDPKAIEYREAAEDFELRFWFGKWYYEVPPLWNPDYPAERFNLGGYDVRPVELTRATLHFVVELRNRVAHRNHLGQGMLCWYAQLAILLLVLFDGRILAMEMEILVEGFLSVRSREKVLRRLFECYDGTEVPTDQLGECKRRDAILTIYGSMNGLQPPDGTRKASTSNDFSSSSGCEPTGTSTVEGALSCSSSPPRSATAATLIPEEVNAGARIMSSGMVETLGYEGICNLAIEKYVNSDFMYEPLRLKPTAPKTQPGTPTVETPAEGTAMQEESEALSFELVASFLKVVWRCWVRPHFIA